MTNEERFAKAWADYGRTYRGTKSVAVAESCFRAGFLSAAPPDDVRETLIEACDEQLKDYIQIANEQQELYGVCKEVSAWRQDVERLAAARKWLEVKKDADVGCEDDRKLYEVLDNDE